MTALEATAAVNNTPVEVFDNSLAQRPNVLVFLTDDQGPWALTRTMPELVTPTIDELMEHSTVFNSFYCASPVCSPARASLITGRMPSAHGIHDWLVGERYKDSYEDNYLGGLVNLPEILHHAGYMCGMSGKWHMGTSRRPALGFDLWYAHRVGGGPYYNAPIWSQNGERLAEPRYFTYAVGEEAEHFIDTFAEEQRASRFGDSTTQAGTNWSEGAPAVTSEQVKSRRPFYLQVNFTAPHDPWINSHPQDLYDLYKNCDFPSIPREEPHEWVEARREDFANAFANPIPYLQGYAASLSGVDRAVKNVIERLKANNLLENTIIVYTSDNGFSCGHHGYWGKGNGTYPMNFWEHSVRVPFFVHLPNQQKSYNVDESVSSTSFLETICDLVGVTAPEDPLRAGHSFAGYLNSAQAESEANSATLAQNADTITHKQYDEYSSNNEAIVVYDEYGGGRMVKSGNWKLIERYNGPGELYNLANDPNERENQYNNQIHANIQKELHDRLTEWFKAHETAVDSAYHRDVRGRGQIQPPRRGLDDAHTYYPYEALHGNQKTSHNTKQ